MSSPPSAPRPRRRWLLPLAVLLLAGVGVTAYLLWPRPNPQPDLTAAAAANTRGVGRMERYEYAEAEAEFAEAVRLAPDWPPARINLGIAQFNQDTPEAIARARATFAEVLARNPADPHAHYCLGIIAAERGPFAEAYPHFRAAHEADPDDPHTLLRLGMTHPAGKDSAEARDYFGGSVVQCDFNGDGRPDVFLASAVVEGGKLRDLLLRNDGGGAFTDITAAAGLAARASLGAAAGDYDNDGRPDLALTGADGVRLLRNKGDGTFDDVT